MLITVSKQALIVRLEENRARHREVFLEAIQGYRRHAESILTGYVKALRDGKAPEICVTLSRPEDHARDYDRVIGMLKMDAGETFELNEETYARYVEDDWAWKRQWARISSAYAADAVSRNYGDIGE